MDWTRAQTRLRVKPSGVPDPATIAAALSAAAGRSLGDFGTRASAILSPLVRKWGLDKSAESMAQFLANTAHETGDYTVFSENLCYTHASALVRAWPMRFNLSSAENYLNSPQRLAEYVYGERFGNPPGRAWDYRGGGWIQTTFLDNYARVAHVTGVPLVAQPQILHDPYTSIEPACIYWSETGCPALATVDPTGRQARTRVNGGTVGLDDVVQRVSHLMGVLK